MYPWTWNFADEVLTREISALGVKPLKLIVEEFESNSLHYCLNTSEFNDFIQNILDRLERDRSFFEKVVERISTLSTEMISFSSAVTTTPQDLSDEELVNLIDDYISILKELRLWGWVPPLIDGVTIPLLSQSCIEAMTIDFPHLSKEEINVLFSLLTTPSSFGEVQKSEIDKYNLVINLGDSVIEDFISHTDSEAGLRALPEDVQDTIRSYVGKYGWITYNYSGPIFNLDMLKESLRDITVKKAKENLRILTEKIESTKSKQVKALSKYDLRERTRYLIEIASTFMPLKEYRKSVYQRSYVAMEPVLRDFSRRIDCSFEETRFLSRGEFSRALETPGQFKSLLKDRSEYCLVLVENGESRFFSGEEGRVKASSCIVEEIKDTEHFTELHGQVAFPGDVQGRARIIVTVHDISKMNEGDVLVSPATNPDLLVAMKKAAAFVTDRGGITCHAAIVSRELQIPCIVGTRNATSVIKDGDMIRVNAKEGVVFLLNH